MKTAFLVSLGYGLLSIIALAQTPFMEIPNTLISFTAFEKSVEETSAIRPSRRLTEKEFLHMMRKPGVVVLDARSNLKFKLRHIEGAVNLSLPDFTEADLAQIIPSKDTTVLIYCNNNFEGSPISFASKTIGAALNLHTFVSLRSYGYTQVYELGPLLDVKTTALPFAGEEVGKK